MGKDSSKRNKMQKNNLKFANEFAADYDNSILQNNWIGPEVIFNSINNLLKSNANILDLGIGTGESSLPFQKAGHSITGIDGSANMLEQCRKKKIGSALILHNLEEMSFPIKDKLFDAIISNGVFHLIHPLKPIFSEVKRLLKPDGIFAFTFEGTKNISGSKEIENGIWEKKTETGVFTYKHSPFFIQKILLENNFAVISKNQFLAFKNKKSQTEFYFNAIVAQLQRSQ